MSMAKGSTKTFLWWKLGIKASSTQTWWVITAGSYNRIPIPHTSARASVSQTSEPRLNSAYADDIERKSVNLKCCFWIIHNGVDFPIKFTPFLRLPCSNVLLTSFSATCLFMFLVCILHIIHGDQSLLSKYDVKVITKHWYIRCTIWWSAIIKYLI